MLDFDALKRQHPIDKAAERLGIKVSKYTPSQLRAQCPRCKGSDRELAITHEKGLAYCFSEQKGGDALWLIQHVNGGTVKEAAEWLAGTKPESERGDRTPNPQSFDRAKYQATLSREVEGIPKELCERADIGISSKGALRGIVLPIYDKDTGDFICYAKVEGLKLPRIK